MHPSLQVIFPGCTIPSPALAQPTFNDIKNFACTHRVDFVSAAYIQTAEDAQYLRRFMVECDHGDSIRLIARIENEAGLRNVDDILGEADGIMLCRTSLAQELGPDKLGLMQKLVAAKAQAAGLTSLPCFLRLHAHAVFCCWLACLFACLPAPRRPRQPPPGARCSPNQPCPSNHLSDRHHILTV